MNQPPPPPPGQQPYPGQTYAPYPPPQPPKKGLSTGAIVAIVLGSVFGAIVLIGLIGAMVSSGTDTDGKASPKRVVPATSSAEELPTGPEQKSSPIKVSATSTAFQPGVLHDGAAHTSVAVTVTNGSTAPISINPLYFSITDTAGSKHVAELGADERQMDTVDLAPGENITGVITGKGEFTPKYVTYVDGLRGNSVRGDVVRLQP